MKKHTYDIIVVGSGIAGLNFALDASKHGRVAVITKKELMESNSNYAQGGIAAVLDKHDSFEQHIEDTLVAGCHLNNKDAVDIMVREAPEQIYKLIDLGVGFSRNKTILSLTQEGGHSARRIAHAHDATGKEIERALIFHARNNPHIDTFESHIAIDLIIEDGVCRGVTVLDVEEQTTEVFEASTVALATGGAAQVYARNCNPKIATGDGVAMAARAGATIEGMEFMQFHPTALAMPNQPTFLVSETVRGEGGVLKHEDETTFMENYHEKKEMAPRDIVSRAIYSEMKKGPVFLDIRHKGSQFIKARFPYIYEKLWWFGIKMDKDMIPVAPAAHYTCGGIQTSVDGETSITGLFAFGEVAHTGVHGANRLASNSLLECMVFGTRAAKKVAEYLQRTDSRKQITVSNFQFPISTDKDKEVLKYKEEVQRIMWGHVGIVRNQNDMEAALEKLQKIYQHVVTISESAVSSDTIETRNLARVAILITKAALSRKESIGCHFIS